MISLPAPSIISSYLRRSAALWIGARGLLVFQQLMAQQDPFTVGVSLTTIVVTLVLCLVEIERRRERALLGNLGVRSRDLIPVMLVPPAVGETALQLTIAVSA